MARSEAPSDESLSNLKKAIAIIIGVRLLIVLIEFIKFFINHAKLSCDSAGGNTDNIMAMTLLTIVTSIITIVNDPFVICSLVKELLPTLIVGVVFEFIHLILNLALLIMTALQKTPNVWSIVNYSLIELQIICILVAMIGLCVLINRRQWYH